MIWCYENIIIAEAARAQMDTVAAVVPRRRFSAHPSVCLSLYHRAMPQIIKAMDTVIAGRDGLMQGKMMQAARISARYILSAVGRPQSTTVVILPQALSSSTSR